MKCYTKNTILGFALYGISQGENRFPSIVTSATGNDSLLEFILVKKTTTEQFELIINGWHIYTISKVKQIGHIQIFGVFDVFRFSSLLKIGFEVNCIQIPQGGCSSIITCMGFTVNKSHASYVAFTDRLCYVSTKMYGVTCHTSGQNKFFIIKNEK
ncbi:hypothetical protein CHS0354_021691 [Potamilus streckersoni]|uniref:Uncharacterized protein n=1 Tax=Potamilus streckersoni TaxID=2493646 RepID=A0AAE0WGK3_9BIVA|nr:hypothetical protein CHS0354_021691 [Potamilus streckersoni]